MALCILKHLQREVRVAQAGSFHKGTKHILFPNLLLITTDDAKCHKCSSAFRTVTPLLVLVKLVLARGVSRESAGCHRGYCHRESDTRAANNIMEALAAKARSVEKCKINKYATKDAYYSLLAVSASFDSSTFAR